MLHGLNSSTEKLSVNAKDKRGTTGILEIYQCVFNVES